MSYYNYLQNGDFLCPTCSYSTHSLQKFAKHALSTHHLDKNVTQAKSDNTSTDNNCPYGLGCGFYNNTGLDNICPYGFEREFYNKTGLSAFSDKYPSDNCPYTSGSGYEYNMPGHCNRYCMDNTTDSLPSILNNCSNSLLQVNKQNIKSVTVTINFK